MSFDDGMSGGVEPFDEIESDTRGDDEIRLVSPRRIDALEDLLEELHVANQPIYRNEPGDYLEAYAIAVYTAQEMRNRLDALLGEMHVGFKVARS